MQHDSNSAPFALFGQWFADAKAGEPNDPEAMSVVSVDADGQPSVRIVLMRAWDERGFVFFTNMESRKATALKAHPGTCLNFHWKSLHRQVRIEGDTEIVTDAEADAYFARRYRASQIGAWASDQSQPLDRRETFLARIAEVTARFEGKDVSRPPHWSGFRVRPHRIEFWEEVEFRLHHRRLFTRIGETWTEGLLYP
jgi:pyridoxamine 5'-phosphate oxidase